MASGIERARRTIERRSREVRTRLTPFALARVPIDGLSTAMERMRRTGGKATAIRIGRAATRQVPGSGKAHRYLVRALLTEPLERGDVLEARALAETMIRLYDDAMVSDQFIKAVIAQHRCRIDDPDLVTSAMAFVHDAPDSRRVATRRLWNYLLDCHDEDLIARFGRALGNNPPDALYAQLNHEMLLRAGRVDAALNAEQDLADIEWSSPDDLAILEARRHAQEHSPADSLRVLAGVKPLRSGEFSREYLRASATLGKYEEILAYLDDTAHCLTSSAEAVARFDALWPLGRESEAIEIISALAEPSPLADLDVFRRLSRAAQVSDDVASELDHLVRRYEISELRTESDLDSLSSIYFELDRLDDLVALATSANYSWRFGALGRYNVARTFYVKRDFDTATEWMRDLEGTLRHWESKKLAARILLETGAFEDSLRHRACHPHPMESLDEVTVFARLQLGRFDDAFAAYVSQSDRDRLDSVFGEQATQSPAAAAGGSVFVISQNGPGDEIQTAATIPLLRAATSELTMTCDPRLESLMARSFPDVAFVPVSRTTLAGALGALHPAGPPRSNSILFDLLTADAHAVAIRHDRVALSRSLPRLTTSAEASPPFPPYITTQTSPPIDALGRSGRPVIGVVWRSELSSPMRSIHYLSVDDLAPLWAGDHDVVCLQHNATGVERDTLIKATDGRVIFLDDVDLRDDFEAAAAAVRSCAAVVGVGTTMVELAAAVGTPTILLEPNHHGSWRRQENSRDYWHRDALVAVTDDPRRPERCVSDAVRLLARMDLTRTS